MTDSTGRTAGNVETQLNALWKRTDQNAEALHKLETGHEVINHELATQREQLQGLADANAKQHTELKTMVGGLGSDVKTVIADYHERKGQAKYRTWLLPVIVSLFSIAAGAVIAALSMAAT